MEFTEFLEENKHNPFSPLRNGLDKLRQMLLCRMEFITSEAEAIAAGAAAPAEPSQESLKGEGGMSNPEAEIQGSVDIDHANHDSEPRKKEQETSQAAKLEYLENRLKTKDWLLETRDVQLKKIRAELLELKIRLASIERDELRSNSRGGKLWKMGFGR
ncbi:MAG: hypothetical protein ACE5HC_03750 [Candidatus Binatia bacterium]